MAIELSLFALHPRSDSVEAGARPTLSSVDGGGSRLHDALAIVSALGQSHATAGALLDRNDSAVPAERRFHGVELDVLRALVEDAVRQIEACVGRDGSPRFPAIEALLREGVVEVIGDRVVLRRSGHGLGRVVADLISVAELLDLARNGPSVVVCDFDEPDGCPL